MPAGAAKDVARPLRFRSLLERDHHPVAVFHQPAHRLFGFRQVGHRQLAAGRAERSLSGLQPRHAERIDSDDREPGEALLDGRPGLVFVSPIGATQHVEKVGLERLHPGPGPGGIQPDNPSPFGKQGEQVDRRDSGLFGSRVQADALHRAERPLRIHREAAQALDLVSPELDPDRVVLGGREDIDDAAAHREISGVFHLVPAGVSQCRQSADELLEVHASAGGNERGRPRGLDDTLQEGRRLYHHHGLRLAVGGLRRRGESGHRSGPATGHSRLDLSLRPVPHPPGRQVDHRPVGAIQRQLVLELEGRFLVWDDHQQNTLVPGPAPGDGGRQKGMDEARRHEAGFGRRSPGRRGALQELLKGRVAAQEVGQAGHEPSPRVASHSSARSAARPMRARTSSRGSLKGASTWSIRGLLDAFGAAYPHAQPPEIAGSQRLLQAPQAVVAPQPLSFLQADIAEGQFDLVMDHKNPFHRHLVPPGRLSGRAAGEVHEGGRQEKRYSAAGYPALGGEALEPGTEGRETVPTPQLLAHHEAHVVAMELVFRPGIAQRDEQVDGGSFHLCRGSFHCPGATPRS